MESQSVDFKKVFEYSPNPYLLLKPDSPVFTILAVNNAYTQATKTTREQIVGKTLFEVFPDNPNDPNADGVKNLTDSLNQVLSNKTFNRMHIQKYDIPKPPSEGGGFEVRYWDPINLPVFDDDNNLIYIIHHVTDVTSYENLIQIYGVSDTKDFSGQNSQVERLTKLTVAREAKMFELKETIDKLEQKLADECDKTS